MDVSDYYDTEEIDGVYFEVGINTVISEFFKNLIEKAKYFQNIKFKFDYGVIERIEHYNYPTREFLTYINKNFQIFKSDDFQFSTLNKNEYLHICIDQYNYEINWNILDISPIKLPFALKFNLDDFEINPTREVLTIDSDYKHKILNKIDKLADWLINSYNEENPIFECNNIKEYKEELFKRKDKNIKIGNEVIDIYDFCTYYSNKTFNTPTFKEISQAELIEFESFLKHYWNSFYKISFFINNKRRKNNVRFGQFSRDNIFIIEKTVKKIYQEWCKKDYDRYQFYTIDKSFDFIEDKLNNKQIYFQNYIQHIQKGKYKEEEFISNIENHKKLFNKFLFLKKEFENHYFKKIEDVVPLEFINSKPKPVRVKKEKLQKSEEEVFLKYPRTPQKSTDWDAVWKDRNIKVRDLSKLPKLHIYSTEKNRLALEKLFTNFQKRTNTNLQLIMVNEKTEKIIKEENPQNFINIENLKDKFSILSNYITASYIKENLKKYQSLLYNSQLINEHISSNISKDIDKINEILKKYNVENIFYDVERGNCPEIIKSFVNFYQENPKMYNQEYMEIYSKLEKVLSKLDFVDLFINDIKSKNYKTELALKTLREICKIRNIRMNWGNYNLDKIEEFFKPVEEVIPTLELIENE